MKVQKKPLPEDIVAVWPEILAEVSINTIPLPYLHSVIIGFKDDKIWEIKLTAKIKKEGWESFQHSLSGLLISYEDHIDDIDFKLDAVKIKKDIEKATLKFLKKNKL